MDIGIQPEPHQSAQKISVAPQSCRKVQYVRICSLSTCSYPLAQLALQLVIQTGS